MFHRGQRGLVDVGTCNVPTRREAGLVEDYRPLGISHDAITMADYETTGLVQVVSRSDRLPRAQQTHRV